MKRLVETAPESGGPEARLAELVRSAEPFRANPFTKRLVAQRIARASVQPAWLSAHPVAAAWIGSVGVAAAATAGWVAARSPEPTSTPPTIAHVPVPRASGELPPRPREVELEPAPPPLTPALPSPAPARVEAHPTRDVRSRSVSEGEDPSQVLEAIRALRKRGDAAHAQVLLDKYLAAHPGGALTEDALALAIEAASARHDPRAAEYARRYLARFPNGRFRSIALRASGRE